MRARLFLLLTLALLARALVPSGWMPVATPQGVRFALCPGQGDAPVASAGMYHGQHQHPGKAMPDQPCAFAGIGLAADVATAPVLLASQLAPVAAHVARPPVVAVGRGLAAPPPPATGPPAFA